MSQELHNVNVWRTRTIYDILNNAHKNAHALKVNVKYEYEGTAEDKPKLYICCATYNAPNPS